jgi:hypothetical protein
MHTDHARSLQYIIGFVGVEMNVPLVFKLVDNKEMQPFT